MWSANVRAFSLLHYAMSSVEVELWCRGGIGHVTKVDRHPQEIMKPSVNFIAVGPLDFDVFRVQVELLSW